MSRRPIKQIFINTGLIVRDGLKTLKSSPQIAAYPYIAFLFIVITFPTINALMLNFWHRLSPESLISANKTPRTIRVLVGLVSFSAFYTVLVTAYFTCAISAEVMPRLDRKSVPLIYGFQQMAG